MNFSRPIVLLTIASVPCWAGFTEDFDAAKEKDPQAVEQIQATYAKSESENPDYYIKLANYWFSLSQQVAISTKPAEKSDFVVSDQHNGKAVGSISRQGVVDPKIAAKAPDLLSGAAKKFPNRIDIALGLAYVLRQENRPAESAEVMLGLIEAYRKAPDSFLDKNGTALSGPEAAKTIDNAAYDTTVELYESKDAESPKWCEKLAMEMIDTFPKDARPPNIVAALAIRANDFKGAIGWLEKAHAIDPSDSLVTVNLAEQYLGVGNKKKARELAQSILESPDQAAKEYRNEAKQIIKKAK
jgi:tetratricopeptide (TPR) repeat protein